jgi:sugar phosphate isomerase/epimerase
VEQLNIAVQLWTVRSLLGDARGLASALRAIRRIGYHAVQLAGLGPIPPADVRRVLDDAGLKACSAHEDADELLADPGRVAERLHVYGCASVAYPYPKNQDLSSVKGVQRLCRALTKAGKVFRAEGILFAYHHHHLEFQRLGGRTVMDMILEQVDPGLLEIEPDTYWLQAGGVDPVEWIRRCARRESLLHLKDYGVDPTGKPLFREIGAGNLDWNRILPAARRAGCRWYIVEQDDHWRTGDPLASLRESWRFLRRMPGEGGTR